MKFVISTIAAMVLVFGIFVVLDKHEIKQYRHSCYAPCTVILPPNTEEDQFDFNYTWPDKDTSVVEVWKEGQ